jgi:hypothetical protein
MNKEDSQLLKQLRQLSTEFVFESIMYTFLYIKQFYFVIQSLKDLMNMNLQR